MCIQGQHYTLDIHFHERCAAGKEKKKNKKHEAQKINKLDRPKRQLNGI